MKLVLYSGGATSANRRLHAQLGALAGGRKRMSMTYVPFCAAGSEPFFERFKRRYEPFGFKTFRSFPVDRPFTKAERDAALASDALYLAGGNTFYFLHHLRKQGLLRRFRQYAIDGGVMAGLSAGAHILTPHAGLAGYPEFDADPNDVGLRNLNALGLVPFEFFPHYRGQMSALRTALVKYSRSTRHAVVAAADGGGVVVDDARMTFVGRLEIFLAGVHAPLSQ